MMELYTLCIGMHTGHSALSLVCTVDMYLSDGANTVSPGCAPTVLTSSGAGMSNVLATCHGHAVTA